MTLYRILIRARLRKAVPVMFLLLTALAGYAAAGRFETYGTFITIDYRRPFGNEVLVCDVAIDNVADAKPVKSGSGE